MARPPSSQRPPAKRQQASSRSIRQSVAAPRQRAALSRRTIQGRLVKQKARVLLVLGLALLAVGAEKR